MEYGGYIGEVSRVCGERDIEGAREREREREER